MYCKYCGEKLEGKKNFCKTCGRQLKKESEHEKRYNILIIIALGLMIILFVPYQESYQVSYQEPVYRTEYYQEPVYVTKLELGIGVWNSGLTLYNVKSYNCEYMSTGFWGTQYYSCNIDGKIYEHVVSWRPTQAFDHYEKLSKKVFDHDETKYRTEYKTVTLLNKLLG